MTQAQDEQIEKQSTRTELRKQAILIKIAV